MIGRISPWLWSRPAGKDVVVLGAGFSKAVSCHFPLIAELGEEAFERSEIPPTQRAASGTGFETWLSRIAEDQPYRSVEENLEAKRRFVQMSEAIAAVLGERQLLALGALSPRWLDDLLSVLHANQATVVSFNYDNVLECAVDGHCLADRAPGWASPTKVTSHDIVDRLPPLPPGIVSEELRQAMGYGAGIGDPIPVPRDPDRVARTFRLLKLHGSLSWYWSPDDQNGVTLQRWRTPGTFGAPTGDDQDARRRALPGRTPFIVPPTAIKSSYLTNLVVRELWGRARAALAEATRLILVGYSIPPEDQVSGGMFADALRGGAVEVVVVDPAAEQVVDRLERLGIAAAPPRCFTGCSCVENFADWYRDEKAAQVVVNLREWAKNSESGVIRGDDRSPGGGDDGLQGQVHVEWGPCDDLTCRGTVAFYRHGGDVDRRGVEAVEEDLRVPIVGLGTQSGKIDQAQVPTLLRHLAEAGQIRRLVVQAGGREFPVVDYVVSPPTSNVQGGIVDPSNHLTLVPSGHPRC